MSEWKVSVEKIEIFPHPTADAMELGKVGTSQVCVQKNLYKDGDLVAFAPEKSVLPNEIKAPWENYLKGSNKDRVGSVRLRGEFSCGIILPLDIVHKYVTDYQIGEDISVKLGITKYEPPVPVSLSGEVSSFSVNSSGEKLVNEFPDIAGKHDCEHYRTYSRELVLGERVWISEKLHGSQFILSKFENDVTITSKGLLKSGLHIRESERNSYWQAFKNSNLNLDCFDSGVTRIFGEMIPCQSGYSYGQMIPIVKIFDIRVDGQSIPYDQVPEQFKKLWVPVLYDGPYSEDLVKFCEGKEQVSGKELHIREGAVISPYIDRRACDYSRLRLKMINPKYKETGEEFN